MSLTRGRELPIGARAGLLDPKHVRAMGSARWLYDWILWRVTSEQDGVGRVLGGSPVRCEEIAADLGVGLRTIYRWMNRLRGPYIRTRHVVVHGRHGLAIEVLKSKKFHPCRPSGISYISTVSTANPASSGRGNPARFGRDNPAKSGSFHKEYRKPVTESYGKCNTDCQKDLRERANWRQASPPSPPVPEEQRPKQAPRSDSIAPRNDLRRDSAHHDSAPLENVVIPSPGSSGARNLSGNVLRNDGGDGDERELIDDLRRQLGAQWRQMAGGKSLPVEPDAARREMLERQKCDLLRRAAQRSLPP